MIPAAPVVAVLDASVLYPASLRDVLMRLAAERLFQPKWTERIHDEWMRNLMKNRPDLTRAQIERTRALMDRHGGDWQVPPYEHLVPTLSLPDPDDRHVLAAAIASGAPFIVTGNLRHFPAAILAPQGIVALHPDDFVCALLDGAPEAFLACLRRHRESLRNPPRTAQEHIEALRHAGLVNLADRLEPLAGAI
jgi:predicted nucleic acid-binding protein